jgi:hypothetical protein
LISGKVRQFLGKTNKAGNIFSTALIDFLGEPVLILEIIHGKV